MSDAPAQIASQDGTSLAWHHWPASTGSAAGSVLLVHGLGEHLGRYDHVATALARRGFDVGGVDLRGHGLSAGRRGHLRRWSDYVADVQAAAAQLPDPLYLVAHSMGGLVALDYLRDAPRVQAVVLSGPLLGVAVEAPRWKTSLAGLLSRLAPGLQLANEIDPQEVCGNLDVVRRYEEDPLNFNCITPRWYTEMHQALQRVHGAVERYRLPLQLHAGEEDRIVSLDEMNRFYASWPGPKTRQLWPHGKHEVFNEAFGDEVIRAVGDWLEHQRAGSSPSSRTA